jgi:hypothetical protein
VVQAADHENLQIFFDVTENLTFKTKFKNIFFVKFIQFQFLVKIMDSVDDLFDCFDEDETKTVTQPVLVKEDEEKDVEIM